MTTIFAVYDNKAQAFHNPFFSHNRATALRGFTAAVNSPDHEFNKWSEDFVLFELGEFDTKTGNMELYEAPVNLGMAAQYLDRPEPEQKPLRLAVSDQEGN